MFTIAIFSLLPEFFLSFCILIFLICNSSVLNSYKFNFPVLKKELFSQIFLTLIFSIVLLFFVKIEGNFANSLFTVDLGTTYLKLIWMFFCISAFVLIWRSFLVQKLNFFEFFFLFLLIILSSTLLLSSSDLLSIYLIIELQSICFYISSSFRRDTSFSSEAGLKYFISSAFMSCVFLLGASFIYGALGTLNFNSISLLLSFPFNDGVYYVKEFVVAGSGLITVFFLFKLSIAPFHFWFPQIYDGSPLSATILFSILPKFVIFTLLIKWLSVISVFSFLFTPILLFFGLVSSVFGVFMALRQKKIKKLFIYSSIGQLGLPLCSLALGNFDSIVNTFFFLIIYLITSVLTWGYYLTFFSSSSSAHKGKESIFFITFFSNLHYFNKVWSLSVLFIFFSMCGVPPFSGFISKFWVYVSLIQSNFFLIAIFAILLGSFSAFYYIKLLKVTFFENKAFFSFGDNSTVFKNQLFFVDSYIFSLFLFLLVFFSFYSDIVFYTLNFIVSIIL